MKILFWTEGFWPCLGGIETQALLFIKAMQERGHQCLVIAQKEFPAVKDEEIYQGIPIHRFDFKGVILNRGIVTFGSVKKSLEELLSKFRPDIVHVNTCIGPGVIVFSMLRSLFLAPVVLTIHSPHYGNGVFLTVGRICSQADRIGCVSKWVIHETEKHLPQIKEKLRLIYNGLPLFEIPPTPLCFSPPVLLILGRLAPEKGFKSAIEAVSLLRKNGCLAKLIIAGDGIDRPALHCLVKELGLDDAVEFTGSLQRDEIPHVINRASLVLIPSYFESFGLVALEAMQMGRPVIASNIGGLPEIITDSGLGCLVPPKDPEALRRAIQDLLNQPQKAIAMGKRARQYAMENFTMRQNATHYEQLYRELV